MIDVYVKDIMNALKNRSYFSALALALALPDMCGAVEYPNESVSERYIKWYQEHVEPWVKKEGKDNPDLSGEVVYNLRNTFLHQGLPAVNAGKIKEESNRVNKFILVLGDGTVFQEVTLSYSVGASAFRAIMVEVTFLCETICSCALDYYIQNSSRFVPDCIVLTQDELFGRSGEPVGQIQQKDIELKFAENALGVLFDKEKILQMVQSQIEQLKKEQQPKKEQQTKKTKQQQTSNKKVPPAKTPVNVSGEKKTKLNQEIMQAARTIGYDASTANKIAQLSTGMLGSRNFLNDVLNAFNDEWSNGAEVYEDLKPVLSKYASVKPQKTVSQTATAKDKSAVNKEVMQILSKAGLSSDDVAKVASIVVKNHGVKKGKQTAYRTIVSRYGQEKGLDIYKRVKKYI